MKSGCVNQEEKATRSVELPVLAVSSTPPNLIRKSRTGRWRAAALITLSLLMAAHVVQWRLMGSTVSPIEPSEAMYTIQSGAINAGFIFFSLAIIAKDGLWAMIAFMFTVGSIWLMAASFL